eukprot:UN04634
MSSLNSQINPTQEEQLQQQSQQQYQQIDTNELYKTVPTPEELALLRDLRVELRRKKGFDENHLLLYKGLEYNPDKERQVLGTGAGIIGLIAIGTCALATVHMTKVSGPGGFLLKCRNWWISTPIGRMMDGKNARRVHEQHQRYEALRRNGFRNETSQQSTSVSSSTTTSQQQVVAQKEVLTQKVEAAAEVAKPRILVQEPLPPPVGATTTFVEPMPTPPNTIQPVKPPAAPQPDWAKFQRREGKTIQPSMQKAYDLKI